MSRVETFRAKYNRDPASFAGLQYDAMMLLDAAVREVKGNLKQTGERIKDAFRGRRRRRF